MRNLLQINHLKLNTIDVINSLLISIVLYLHHGDYTKNYLPILSELNVNLLLQKFAVGGFFFFSGLKLAISNINYPSLRFLRKRFIRIYFPYLLALIVGAYTFYPSTAINHGQYPSIKNFILHILCLQTTFPGLYGQMYSTVWFVPILFSCYLFFIFARKDINDTRTFLLKTALIFIFISSCYLITFGSSLKLFLRDHPIYLLFFASGMFSSKLELMDNRKYLHITNGAFCSFLLLIFYETIKVNTYYKYIAYCFLVLSSNLSLLYLLCIMLRKIILKKSKTDILPNYSCKYRFKFKENKFLHIANGMLCSFLIFIIYNKIYIITWHEHIIYSFLVISCSSSLLYLLFIILDKAQPFSSNTARMLSIFSSGSFCVFLFHRPIWSLLYKLWPRGTFAQWFFMIIIGIPAIIILSYFLQLTYNQFLQYHRKSESTQ